MVRALQAAAGVAAELLDLDAPGVIAEGEIAEGEIADAMPGDPSTDLDVTGRIDLVMKDGAIYKAPHGKPKLSKLDA